jgi:dienelactone hydrolase
MTHRDANRIRLTRLAGLTRLSRLTRLTRNLFRMTPAVGLLVLQALSASAQPYGQPDRREPGDRQIQEYLAERAERLEERFAEDLESLEKWETQRPQRHEEFLHMLGLWPLPDRTPLAATITGTYQGDGFEVDLLHYQSLPGLYVTANLYRPATREDNQRFPAVLYVCGHSHRGPNGNKTAFQSHGIWFARHGYICLIVDTLQLGEISALHHGTYREQRWWWHSRGYTPAGVECWNGIRGIDYLVSRDDVDAERLAVTGISGGGAATFWVACADPRVQVAVPVSGMADLSSYVANRVVNGHCDCMFLYNTFQWPWTRIAALLAPRPTLFVNSDQDAIFPMDANERISNRLERFYSLYGAGDQFDTLVSIGGHAYRQDIRQGVARFMNTHLQHDPRRVLDTEVDVIGEEARGEPHPIPPEKLRVFAGEDDIPPDQRNTTIDETFVPRTIVALPSADSFDSWKEDLLKKLRRVTFGAIEHPVPPAEPGPGLDLPTEEHRDARTGRESSTRRASRDLGSNQDQVEGKEIETGTGTEEQPTKDNSAEIVWLRTESSLQVRFQSRATAESELDDGAGILLLVADRPLEDYSLPNWHSEGPGLPAHVFVLEPRGIGGSRWTDRNPPNYVRRSHVLLGSTVESGQVWDIMATARYLRQQFPQAGPIWVGGEGATGLCAAYAGIWETTIAGVTLANPPTTHMDSAAPAFLNILRVCDVPEALGLLAPKPLRLLGSPPESFRTRLERIYEAAGASEHFHSAGNPPDTNRTMQAARWSPEHLSHLEGTFRKPGLCSLP